MTKQPKTAAKTMATKSVGHNEMLQAKGDDELLLEDLIIRTGQERSMRRMLLGSGEFSPEAIAMMDTGDVCDCIQKSYAVVGFTDTFGDNIIVVRREDMEAFSKLVKYISR